MLAHEGVAKIATSASSAVSPSKYAAQVSMPPKSNVESIVESSHCQIRRPLFICRKW